MAEVIGGHRDLIALRRTLRLLQLRLVHRGIADQRIHSSGELLHRRTDAVQITQIHQHMLETVLGNLHFIGSTSRSLGTAVGGDHRPAPFHEGLGGVETDPRGGAGDQNGARSSHRCCPSEAISLQC